MKNNKSIYCFVLSIIAACGLLFPRAVSAQTPWRITVCPTGTAGQNGCDFVGGDGIQAAVDAAPAGTATQRTIILIKKGNYSRSTYTEGVSITNRRRKLFVSTRDKNVVLQGENGTMLDGAASAIMAGIGIFGGNVDVKGMKISGFRTEPNSCDSLVQACSEGDGISALQNSIVNISGNVISNNAWGIAILSTQATIANNILTNSQYAGIYLYGTSNSTVVNNTSVQNGYTGIDIEQTASALVVNNISAFNTQGGILGASKNQFQRLEYNLSFGNAGGDYNNTFGAWPPANNYSVDPKFVNRTAGDLRLLAGSPALHTGDPTIHNLDGTRSNVGVHGSLPASWDYTPVGTTLNSAMESIDGILFDPNAGVAINVPNSSFELGTGGWLRSGDISTADFQAFSCTQPWCAVGDKFLKVVAVNDNVAPFDPWVVSDWIDTGAPVVNTNFILKFFAKAHASPRNMRIQLQRYPIGSDWSNTLVTLDSDPSTSAIDPFMVDNVAWKLYTGVASFPALSGYTDTRLRIVIRPLQNSPSVPTPANVAPFDNQPVYIDNFILTDDIPDASAVPVTVHVYDVGSDQQLGGTVPDTQLASIQTNPLNGVFNFAVPASIKDGLAHNIQFWAINKDTDRVDRGTQVDGTFMHQNITFGKNISYVYTQTPSLTPTPTGGAVPTITPIATLTPRPTDPACARKTQGDANCDAAISGADYSIWLNSQCHPAAGQSCSDLRADFNGDGNVDDTDYQAWFTNRGT